MMLHALAVAIFVWLVLYYLQKITRNTEKAASLRLKEREGLDEAQDQQEAFSRGTLGPAPHKPLRADNATSVQLTAIQGTLTEEAGRPRASKTYNRIFGWVVAVIVIAVIVYGYLGHTDTSQWQCPGC
jgi:hypothetical protein